MKKNIILLCVAALLIVAPFIINTNGEYEGADAQAEVIINEINAIIIFSCSQSDFLPM